MTGSPNARRLARDLLTASLAQAWTGDRNHLDALARPVGQALHDAYDGRDLASAGNLFMALTVEMALVLEWAVRLLGEHVRQDPQHLWPMMLVELEAVSPTEPATTESANRPMTRRTVTKARTARPLRRAAVQDARRTARQILSAGLLAAVGHPNAKGILDAFETEDPASGALFAALAVELVATLEWAVTFCARQTGSDPAALWAGLAAELLEAAPSGPGPSER